MNDNAFEDIGGGCMPLAVQKTQVAPSALANTDQSRAVAEAQASLVIAQARPRNEVDAREKIMQACQRASLAQVAVYAFPRGGQQVSGPSVRLAEAAARAWGNMTYGFRELNRAEGASEVESFAWDLETNTKAVRQFAVKHVRDKRGGPTKLTDERDIYEMIANQAQRRVRACILEIIPGDIIEDAVKQCEKTLSVAVSGKNGESLENVVRSMVSAFDGFGVNKAAIEKRIGHRIESIQPAEVLRLREIYASIKDGFSTAEEWFDMEASSQERTAEILNRAAQVQDPPAAQPQDVPQDASAPSDATKQPRATAALRDEVVAMAESVGLDVPTIEKELGAYARNWTYAQCEDVRARASAVADQMAQDGEGGE